MAKQLGTVTKRVVARAIAISRAATLADAEMEKSRSPKAPAKVTGQRQIGTESSIDDTANAGGGTRVPSTMDRCGPAHSKGARPTLGAGQHVFTVIQGGRQAPEEEREPAGLRCAGRGPARELVLIVTG